MSRLPLLPPSTIEGDQKAYYDYMSQIIDQHFGNKFASKNQEGSFIGPFGLMMHAPTLGKPFLEFTLNISQLKGFLVRTREIAILTVGAHYNAQYELYAHKNVMRSLHCFSEEDIVLLSKGERPSSLSTEDELAFDVAKEMLTMRRPLRNEVYDRALRLSDS